MSKVVLVGVLVALTVLYAVWGFGELDKQEAKNKRADNYYRDLIFPGDCPSGPRNTSGSTNAYIGAPSGSCIEGDCVKQIGGTGFDTSTPNASGDSNTMWHYKESGL